jgi:signal transduction histidine kinase/CheY-like chemotaxis protein
MSRFRFGVAKRLFLGLALLMVLALTASITGIVSLARLGDNVNHLAAVELPILDKVTELARQSYAMVALAPSLVNADTQSGRRSQALQIADRSDLFERLLLQLNDAGLKPHDLQGMVQLKNELAASVRHLDGLLEQRLATGGQRVGAIQLLAKARSRLFAFDYDVVKPVEAELTRLLREPASASAEIDAERIDRIEKLRQMELALRQWKSRLEDALADMMAVSGDVHPDHLLQHRRIVAKFLEEAGNVMLALSGPVYDRMWSIYADVVEVAEEKDNIFEVRSRELELLNALHGNLEVSEKASVAFTVEVAQVIGRLHQDLREASGQLRDDIAATYYLLVIMGVGSVVAAGIILIYVDHGVISRLRLLQASMRGRAEGGETTVIAVDGSDEIADMAESVRYFVGAIEQREQALRAATERAERANVAKTHFFAAASHDLRQPLTAMSLLLGVLQVTCRDEGQKSTIDKVQASLDAMVELFNSLLDAAKFELGEVAPQPESIKADDLLSRIENDFQMTAQSKGLKLRVVCSSLMLQSDHVLLERMVRNLVSNAVKYTVEGGILVGIRRRGDTARIEVRDTGPGIPEQALERIFDEFYQLHNPARRRADGHGLGLSIVRRAADLLGHKVAVASVAGQGTCFSIELPFLPAPAATALPTKIEPKAGLVMLIEDDPLVGAAMQFTLQDLGAEVILATSGDQAVEMAPHLARSPDLVIADFRLPGEHNGIETLKVLRQSFGRDMRACLISGEQDPAIRDQANRAGADFMRKPIRQEDLHRLVQAAEIAAE